jgi:glycosyltransferase involved in cell wall biosynthesis
VIRVLQITPTMNRGGIETFLMNIYRNIDRKKVQFDFLLNSKKECSYNKEILELGGRLHYVPPRSQGIIKNRKALNSFYSNHPEYKIVHQHLSSLSYLEPIKFARRHKISHRIVHSHNTKQSGSSIHTLIHRINKLFIDSIATDYFACSKLAAKWLYPNKILSANKHIIINNAIDTKNFIFDVKIREEKRKEFNIKNEVVIGHVGRFTPQKNHRYLIDIFKSYIERFKFAKLLLIGDGPLRQEIEKKVNNLALNDYVIFTGIRSDIPELLQAMDVFVMPSLHEGLPVTLVEAQASGLPCVLANTITKEVGVIDVMKWTSLEDSPDKWADKIESLIKVERRNAMNDMKVAGFDIVSVAESLQEFYLNIDHNQLRR